MCDPIDGEWTAADDAIEEVREIRRQISARFDHDPVKLVAHYMERQKRHGDRLVDLEGLRKRNSATSMRASTARGEALDRWRARSRTTWMNLPQAESAEHCPWLRMRMANGWYQPRRVKRTRPPASRCGSPALRAPSSAVIVSAAPAGVPRRVAAIAPRYKCAKPLAGPPQRNVLRGPVRFEMTGSRPGGSPGRRERFDRQLGGLAPATGNRLKRRTGPPS